MVLSKDRFLGCVMGCAIGESLAKNMESPDFKLGINSRLAICAGDALIRCNGSAETFKESLSASLVSLCEHSPDQLTESMTAFATAAKLQVAVDESTLLGPHSECNSRAVLIGAYWHDIFTKAIQYGIISCEATSESPQAKCGAAAAAVGTLLAFKEVPVGCMASEMGSITAGIDDYFSRCLKLSSRMVAAGISPEMALSNNGLRGTEMAADAMACSIYCAMMAVDFKDAIVMASLCGSMSAVVGCTVGAWVGARMGAQGIPEEWLQKIESKSDLETLASDIEEAFAERKKKKNDLALMSDYA